MLRGDVEVWECGVVTWRCESAEWDRATLRGTEGGLRGDAEARRDRSTRQ